MRPAHSRISDVRLFSERDNPTRSSPYPREKKNVRALIVTIAGLAILVVTAPLSAHHSISRHYHQNESVTIEGVVLDVQLRNPHSQIHMEPVDFSRGAEVWTLELDDIGDLAKQGIVADTIRAGDEIVIVGHPARDGSNSLFIRTLRRPADGLEYEED